MRDNWRTSTLYNLTYCLTKKSKSYEEIFDFFECRADGIDTDAGAYIKTVEIVPDNAPTAIENVVKEVEGSQKVMQNGILYIIRDGKVYNAQGTQVK